MGFVARRRRAFLAAQSAGLNALLLAHSADVRYLCGFTGSAGVLALLQGRSAFFTDGRYTSQVKAEVKAVEVHVVSGSALAAACKWIDLNGGTLCGFDAHHTSVASLDLMRASIPASRRRRFFQALERPVALLREIKEPSEVERLRSAAALGCHLFDKVLDALSPSITEAEVAMQLEQSARRAGAEAMSFETIVASGTRSALPHGRASQQKLPRRGFVTLDFGVILDGYCSDMTRTVHLGRPSTEARAVYDSVLEAQTASLATITSGVSADHVDAAARDVLRRAGLDTYFTHSTGHGVGLEIHEGPRLAAKSTDKLLRGMVVTVEPGVYLPDRYGVRIEDMVLVKGRGHEVLTPSTKALIEL